MTPADAVKAEAAVLKVEAVLTDLLTMPALAFDSKVEHPKFAHERCKLPGCNLRPWGLGNVTPENPRYCAYHEATATAVDRVRAALKEAGY